MFGNIKRRVNVFRIHEIQILSLCLFNNVVFEVFAPIPSKCNCAFVLQLGTCVARDANPAANITWLKNGKPLVADGKGVCSPPCCLGFKC